MAYVYYLGLAVAILALLTHFLQTDEKLSTVMSALHATPGNGTAVKTAMLGFNTNLDLIVDAFELLESLEYAPTSDRVNHAAINTKEEFIATFQHYFSTGSAAERFLVDKPLCKTIMNHAMNKVEGVMSIGGNAGLMGVKFVNNNVKTYIGSVVGPELAKFLGELDLSDDHYEPSADDVTHLIMEYKANSQWGEFSSPRANRFIVHCDDINSRLASLEWMSKALSKEKRWDRLVLAGMHLLEGESPEFRTSRMKEVLKAIGKTEIDAIHLELASIGDTGFLKQLASVMLPKVHSTGMNEQELGDLYVALDGPKYADVEDTHALFKDPTPDTVVQAIKHLFKYTREQKKDTPFGRVHFHSLKFHIIATDSTRTPWAHPAYALAQGSLVATLQSCDFFDSPVDYGQLFLPFTAFTDAKNVDYSAEKPISCWTEDTLTICIVPVMVCKVPVKTVGLGDAISAMGLVSHAVSS